MSNWKSGEGRVKYLLPHGDVSVKPHRGRVPGMIELTLREWAFYCLFFGDKDFYL